MVTAKSETTDAILRYKETTELYAECDYLVKPPVAGTSNLNIEATEQTINLISIIQFYAVI